MRSLGNGIRNFYGQLTISAPNPGGIPLTVNATSGSATAVNVFGVLELSGQANGQIQIFPYGAGATLQAAFQYFQDNNLYIDAPQTGTPTGGQIYLRTGSLHSAVTITAAGAVTIPAPTAGQALTVNGLTNNYALSIVSPNVSGSDGLLITAGTSTSDFAILCRNAAASTMFSVNGAGNVVVAAPASGTAMAINGINGAPTLTLQNAGLNPYLYVTDGTVNGYLQAYSAGAVRFGTLSNHPLAFLINGVQYASLDTSGNLNITNGAGSQSPVYAGIPQNSQTANYTLVLSDANKHIKMNGTNLTVTIPANGSVAFPVGTAVTFYNANASNLTIAITTDTLLLSGGSSSTGSRTLAVNSLATAIKIASNIWIISGSGLT